MLPYIPSWLKSFYQEWISDFVICFFCIFRDDHMFNMIGLCVDLCEPLSSLEFIELLEYADSCFSSNLGNFWPLSLQIFFLPLFLYPLLLGLPLCVWYPTNLWGSVHFSSSRKNFVLPLFIYLFLFFRLDNLNSLIFKFSDSFFWIFKFAVKLF